LKYRNNKIVKENDLLPDGTISELEMEAELRKFFLIRPSISSQALIKQFKTTIQETPNGNTIFLKVISRICKKKGDILVLKDDKRNYH